MNLTTSEGSLQLVQKTSEYSTYVHQLSCSIFCLCMLPMTYVLSMDELQLYFTGSIVIVANVILQF